MQRFFLVIVFSYFFVCLTTSAPTENCTVAGTCDNPEINADQWAARIEELNTFDTSGRTPLMGASLAGKLSAVKNLLAAGSNPNIPASSDGSTALHYAVKHRHHLTVLELLTNNADMFLRNKFHLSPFHLAVLEGDEQSVRLMLDRFMDSDSSYLMMKTPPPAQSDNHSQNQTAAVYVLSAAGVEALLANLGANPLIVACQRGWLSVLLALAERGLPHTLSVSGGSTALMFAAAAGDENIVRTLLALSYPNREQDGVDHNGDGSRYVNALSEDGFNALMLASARGHLSVVRLLVEEGQADVNQRDPVTDRTAMQHAEYNREQHVVDYLSAHGAH